LAFRGTESPGADREESFGVRGKIDFRRLYAMALDRWLGIDSEAVLGKKYDPVEALQV